LGKIYHPAFGEVVSYTETVIPDDPDGQVAATIALMRRYALEDAISPEIQRAAGEIKQASGSGLPYAEACFRLVKGSLKFVEDSSLYSSVPSSSPNVQTVETLVRPRDMLRMGSSGRGARQGDCDDFSMLLASLLVAGDVPCSFVTVAADAESPDRFSHVYVAAYPDGKQSRIALDASHGSYPGWETEQRYRIREFPVTQSSKTIQLLALGLIGYAAVRALEKRN
jgi:hypothetical protein